MFKSTVVSNAYKKADTQPIVAVCDCTRSWKKCVWILLNHGPEQHAALFVNTNTRVKNSS